MSRSLVSNRQFSDSDPLVVSPISKSRVNYHSDGRVNHRVDQVTNDDGSFLVNSQLLYSYTDGRLVNTTFSDPANNQVSVVTQVDIDSAGSNQADTQRHEDERISRHSIPNGHRELTYDAEGRVLTQRDHTHRQESFGIVTEESVVTNVWDHRGRLARVSSSIHKETDSPLETYNSVEHTLNDTHFEYDALDRRIGVISSRSTGEASEEDDPTTDWELQSRQSTWIAHDLTGRSFDMIYEWIDSSLTDPVAISAW